MLIFSAGVIQAMCWSWPSPLYESQLCVPSTWQPEVGGDGSVYTMQKRKCYRSGLAFPSPILPKEPVLYCKVFQD